MQKVFFWTLLVLAALTAGMAVCVVFYTFIKPQIAAADLANFAERAGNIAGWLFGFSFFIGMTASIVLNIRHGKSRQVDWVRTGLLSARLIHAGQVLMAAAFLVIIFSISYTGIKFESGNWMVGGGKGQGWQIVSEPQVVTYLWGDLRAYTAAIVFIATGWMIFTIAWIAQNQSKIATVYSSAIFGSRTSNLQPRKRV